MSGSTKISAFTLAHHGKTALKLSQYPRVLSVAAIGANVVAWAESDGGAEQGSYEFLSLHTGECVPSGAQFVGTVVIPDFDDALPVHVYFNGVAEERA